MNTTKITIKGLTPLLMHNIQLADPLSNAAMTLAKLTSKRNKTHDDHKAVAKAEWYGGLYVDEKLRPCLPGEVVEGAIIEGAKRHRLGQAAKGGIIAYGNFPLEYDGPKSIDKLWEHGGFMKRSAVRVQKARVIRTRPMFPQWSCTFTIQWDPQMIASEDQLMDIVETAGVVGIGDYRPKFGRFEVT